MITAKISSKGQSTIPAEIRRKLAVRPGGSTGCVIDGDRVTLQKVQPFDAAFLRLAVEAFSEWNSPEADEAFVTYERWDVVSVQFLFIDGMGSVLIGSVALKHTPVQDCLG